MNSESYWRRNKAGHFRDRSLDARRWRVANGRGAALAQRLPRGVPLFGAELGVFQGLLSAYLLEARPQLLLFMVDHWRNGHLARAMANTEFALARRHVMRAKTAQAAQWIPDGTLDFVFVDASHGYKDVVADITLWAPKLRKRGILCGHDIHEDDVQRAVADVVGACEIDSDDTWFRRDA